MSTNNYLSSDLSSDKYPYDLVVATSAQSINNTLKSYLFQNPPPPRMVWYKNDGTNITEMTPIDGVDPFAIKEKDQVPDVLSNSDFAFAIKMEFGLPDGVSPDQYPPILILNKEGQEVTYQLYCTDFVIVELDWIRRDFNWSHIQQPAEKPYIFKFTVDLNLDPLDPNADFKNLSPAAQKKIKNLETDSTFSIQQLYFDLNSPALQENPSIEGLKSNSQAYIKLQTDFLNTLWENFKKEGRNLLGCVAKSTNTQADDASVIPTDLTFLSSAYLDDNDKITEQYDLYTLNYLMTTTNRPLKLGSPFSWNWVENNNQYDGSMAIRKAIFVDILNHSLSPALSEGCPVIDVDVHTSGIVNQNVHYDYSYQMDKSPRSFSLVNDGSNKVLHFSYENFDTDDAGPLSALLLTVKYNLDVSVFLNTGTNNQSSITIETNVTVWVHFRNAPFDKEFKLIKKKITDVFSVAATDAGELTMKREGNSKIEDNPDDYGGFLIDLVGFEDKIDKTKRLVEGYVANHLGQYEQEMNEQLNKPRNFVFPGGNTFIFKDANFSEHQDLVCHITYADNS